MLTKGAPVSESPFKRSIRSVPHDHDPEFYPDDPAIVLRGIIDGYQLQTGSPIPAGALDEELLPLPLQKLLEDFRRTKPRKKVLPLTLRTTIDGSQTAEYGVDKLPPEDRLVILSVVETIIEPTQSKTVGNVLFVEVR